VSREVGAKMPVILLIGFIPMLFISCAYKALNSVEPDCGTSFTWVATIFGRHTGWLTGWVIAAADVIVMTNLAETAGSYTYSLINQHVWPRRPGR
jgi:amino acid transporter